MTNSDQPNRKILQQSFPFKSEKSQTIYRLVEDAGGIAIEKMTTSISVAQRITSHEDAGETFAKFIATKQANRAKGKKRIFPEKAFRLHYIDQLSWAEVAQELGVTTGAAVAEPTGKLASTYAHRYMRTGDLGTIADQYDISPNHMHDILCKRLATERSSLISSYHWSMGSECHGGTNGSQIRTITNFLNDWDHVDFIVVSPADDTPIPTNKRVFYDQQFFDVIYASGRQTRLPYEQFDGFFHGHASINEVAQLLVDAASDPIKAILDINGSPMQHLMNEIAAGMSIIEGR